MREQATSLPFKGTLTKAYREQWNLLIWDKGDREKKNEIFKGV